MQLSQHFYTVRQNNRKKPYRPGSIVNVSAMSFGSLSAAAIEALNKGVKKANAYHNTGEGGLSRYHKHGGDIIFHFGTGYFGVRTEDGNFSMEKMKKLVENNPCIKAIEIKLSQGTKPGKGDALTALQHKVNGHKEVLMHLYNLIVWRNTLIRLEKNF
jgi:glutamate synthase domain-containing protein 2